MRKGKVFVLSLVMASLIGILLSSGIASAGSCTVTTEGGEYCFMAEAVDETICTAEDKYGVEWSNDPCPGYPYLTNPPDDGNCCLPRWTGSEPCYCAWVFSEEVCRDYGEGIWITCDFDPDSCAVYCTNEEGRCVPEMSTIALLATGLIRLAGYFRLRRKEE